jgi:hypothetical protein
MACLTSSTVLAALASLSMGSMGACATSARPVASPRAPDDGDRLCENARFQCIPVRLQSAPDGEPMPMRVDTNLTVPLRRASLGRCV